MLVFFVVMELYVPYFSKILHFEINLLAVWH